MQSVKDQVYMQYDPASAQSIEAFGRRLMGRSLRTVPGERLVPVEELDEFFSSATRGKLGTIVERFYFDIQPESDGSPDFKEAGVELKTTPAKRLGKGQIVPKERLVLGMIDYIAERDRTFEESSYFKKNARLLLMTYLHEDKKKIGDLRFLLTKLYDFVSLPEEDRRIIREDWQVINRKIRDGLAHELSEGDTLYLAACTKSSNASITRPQFNGSPAKPRAFSYKQSYMAQLLRREFQSNEDIEQVIKHDEVDIAKTFEEQVLEKFKPFIGKSVMQICADMSLKLSAKQKDKFAVLARAMLSVQKNRIEEFEAAGVRMKTVQLRADGKPKEHMSFPAFRYKEIINQKWDGDEELGEIRSELQEQLESRFLFVIYQCSDKCEKNEERVFRGAFFWTMPTEDLTEGRRVWEETVQLVKEGKLVKNIKSDKYDAERRSTYFTGPDANRVVHVRPHAKNAKDTFSLPVSDERTGRGEYTKHCFWLNGVYIKRIIEQNMDVIISPNK